MSALTLPDLRAEAIEDFLEEVLGRPARVRSIEPLGPAAAGEDPKRYGYGVPFRIDYEVDGRPRAAVLETVAPGPFGHEHMADRAQAILWAHRAYGELPRHVRSLGAGAILPGGRLLPVGEAEEFFLLTEFAPGEPYARDLERLAAADRPGALDLERADALCDYLVEIHSRRGGEPSLWDRRVRELLGHGECAMSLVDSYPADHPWITTARLEGLEHRLLAWRWRLKGRSHRLRRVHGDFHPWNLLFRRGADFTALDRSRGEWGEAADDVTCLTVNYLFFALRRSGRLEGAPAELFRRFWDRYLAATRDREILDVAAPFFAFRCLVLASPVWYPDLEDAVRRKLFRFMERVLESPSFDPSAVEGYLR